MSEEINNLEDKNGQQGFVLFVVLAIASVPMILSGVMISMGNNAALRTEKWRDHDRCLLIAQSALERAKADIQQQFRSHFESAPLERSAQKFDWFDTNSAGSIGSNNPYNAPSDADFLGATISIRIKDVSRVDRSTRDVSLVCSAKLDSAQRTVEEVVRYQLAPSTVFDHAYFINNFGWLWGSSINVNGDVRANGDFSLRSGPEINGDVFAAGNPAIGATGNVTGNADNHSLANYYSIAPSRARPGDPPATNYNDEWPMGYDGSSEQVEQLQRETMPYLGDLSEYRNLAGEKGGQITQKSDNNNNPKNKNKGKGNSKDKDNNGNGGTDVLVDGVYGDDDDEVGPDGVHGTADDGTLVLDGTDDPINLDGPVVATGDVIIRGEVSGQGTIYAGRNIHIAGDVTYQNGPNWPKQDRNPEQTADRNRRRDFLGLAAKGNIILGNYTNNNWRNNVRRYLEPDFTTPYQIDESDAPLGYDSDGNPDNGYRFDGDYTAPDGGESIINEDGDTEARRFYESSNQEAFTEVVSSQQVDRIDAVCYTNHAFAGNVGDLTVNGAIVSRDEAILYSNSVEMNWDIRLGSESNDATGLDFYLPRDLDDPTTIYWREL